MCLGRLVWARKESLVAMNYVGAGICRAAVTVLYVEDLMPDSMCDTPHVQGTIVVLLLSSKVAEGV